MGNREPPGSGGVVWVHASVTAENVTTYGRVVGSRMGEGELACRQEKSRGSYVSMGSQLLYPT